MKKLIILTLAIAMLAGCAPMNKHIFGYEKAIYVKNDLPDVQLYYSMAGVEDKIWWDMPTVQDRAMRLAELADYQGADIACGPKGDFLYTGVE